MSSIEPYINVNTFFRQRFSCRVQKISVDIGLGCPHRNNKIGKGGCIFCNDKGSGTGAGNFYSLEEQINFGKKFLFKRYKAKKFIVYFQSFSNTYATVEKLRTNFVKALAIEDIVGLSIGTRPDCISDEILSLISSLNKKKYIFIEYGLQSIHDKTLKLINRRHDFNIFLKTLEKTRKYKIDVCVHVILGLPQENKIMMLQTAKALANLDIQGIKIHLLYVNRNTILHKLFLKGNYKCLEFSEYIDIICDFLKKLPPQMVIHRITGDPNVKELIAPLWSLNKQLIRNTIRQELIKRKNL